MKKMKVLGTAMAMALILSMSLNSYAQGQNRQCNRDMQKSGVCNNIPDLTEDQQAKIKELRLEQMKLAQDFKNLMGENKAKYRTLMTADKADMTAINKNIDEQTAIKNKMMKAKAKHKQAIRSLLTEEQRIIFDTRVGKKGKGHRGHKGYGMHKTGKYGRGLGNDVGKDIGRGM